MLELELPRTAVVLFNMGVGEFDGSEPLDAGLLCAPPEMSGFSSSFSL